VKVRNIAANPNVALHWQVDESGDGVELWGMATVDTDLETKRRLWTGVFTYNLDDFAPEGLESPETASLRSGRSACWRSSSTGWPAAKHGTAPEQQPGGSFLVGARWV
jgi:general stress protein 26